MPDRPGDEQVAELERLRELVLLRVPDGFRDDDGVWHDGPHRLAFLADLDAIAALLAERERLRGALDEARVVVAAYYEAHVEDDDPACPCEACVRARAVFARTIAEGAPDA